MPRLKQVVSETIVGLIQQGVIYYGNGGARGFDLLSAQCVLSLKHRYPQMKLIMVLPCENQTRGWTNEDKAIYASVLVQADKVKYLSKEYTQRCMLERNDHLVAHSGHCIAYLNNKTGGTAYTVARAQAQGLPVYNVAEYL